VNRGIILVTGATGAIGPSVVRVLNQEGFHIRTFSIDSPAEGLFPQGVEVLAGDVTDKAAVQSAMQGACAIIHMAALLHIINPPSDLQEKYRRVNTGGTANVIDAAVKADVERIVLFSTIAVYGPSDGAVLNESSPVRPDTFYASTKHAAEQLVLHARGSDGRPLGAVLRLGAVYGSRIKGNYRRLTHDLSRHRFVPVGNGLNRRTIVYDKDAARAAALAVTHPAAAGRVFNVTDGSFYRLKDIVESICEALGRKPPQFSIPSGLARLAAGAVEKSGHAVGLKPPPFRAMINKYTEDIAVDGGLIQKEIGFVPQYDLKTGWQETIREMRLSGEL